MLRAWFETWPIAGREPALVDFIRGSTSKILMWTVLVVPDDVADEFVVEGREPERYEDSADEFVFEGSVEAFKDGDGAVLSEGAEARFDAARVAPEFVFFSELSALVTDDVLPRLSTC
jgi:hypothetical protein